MSISNQTNKVFITGDGVTVAFSFAFKIFVASDLLVYKISAAGVATLQTLTTDYSVAINAVSEGGTVTFVVAPASLTTGLIKRSEPFTQSLVLATEGSLPAKQIENQLDLMTMLCVQVNEAVSRCAQLSATSAITAVTLPDPVDGNAPVWSGTAGLMVNAPINTVAIATSVAAAAASQAAAAASQASATSSASSASSSAAAAAASAAAIAALFPLADSNLQQIVTAAKVSGAAITLLNNVPSGAGALPLANSTNALFAAIANYGTSASASTAKNQKDLKIAFGEVSIAGMGNQAITNLGFGSSSSYIVVGAFGTATDASEAFVFVRNTGAQFTIYNNDNMTQTIMWIAIGT